MAYICAIVEREERKRIMERGMGERREEGDGDDFCIKYESDEENKEQKLK